MYPLYTEHKIWSLVYRSCSENRQFIVKKRNYRLLQELIESCEFIRRNFRGIQAGNYELAMIFMSWQWSDGAFLRSSSIFFPNAAFSRRFNVCDLCFALASGDGDVLTKSVVHSTNAKEIYWFWLVTNTLESNDQSCQLTTDSMAAKRGWRSMAIDVDDLHWWRSLWDAWRQRHRTATWRRTMLVGTRYIITRSFQRMDNLSGNINQFDTQILNSSMTRSWILHRCVLSNSRRIGIVILLIKCLLAASLLTKSLPADSSIV